MMNMRLNSTVALVGSLAALTLLATGVRGQKRIAVRRAALQPVPQAGPVAPTPPNPTGFSDGITFDSKPEYKRYITAAQDLIRDKDWSRAAEALQKLLDDQKDFTVEIIITDPKTKQKFPRRVSVRFEANRLIGQMPKEGLETYQSMYGGKAREMLDKYGTTGDVSILAEASYRYMNTKAGAEANELLATVWLDRRDYYAAAEGFKRLLELTRRKELPLEVNDLTLLKAVYAFRKSGDKKLAEQTWKLLEPHIRRTGMKLGEQRVSADKIEQWLDEARPAVVVSVSDWPMWRGNPARNAQANASAPLYGTLWEKSTIDEKNGEDEDGKPTEYPQTREWVQLAVDALHRNNQQPVLPGFFPIAVNGKVIYRTYHGIEALYIKDGEDAVNGKYKAGDLAWFSPMDGSLTSLLGESGNQDVLKDWKTRYQQWMSNLVIEDSSVGTLTADQGKVYAVDDLALLPHPYWLQQWQWGGQPNYPEYIRNLVGQNTLRAYDVETGKLLWELPDKNKKTPADLLETHFLGAPLAVGGKLYVLNEKRGELRLLVLKDRLVESDKAPANGQPLWEVNVLRTQVLCNVKDPITRDISRRMHTVPLAYAEGVLVIPTNAGAVLGVDLLTQTLIWSYAYREGVAENPPMPNNPWGGRGIVVNGRMPLSYTSSDFHLAPPAIVDGKIVFAAPDGQSIHCVSLREGKRLWLVKRTDDLYLGGVYGKTVVMVGKSGCRGLNLADGRPLWAVETGTPTGQGVASRGIYYLPVQNKDRQGEIVAIDITKGTIRAHNKARGPKTPLPGNLLFHEGALLSQNTDSIAAFPQLDVKIKEIDEALAKKPGDPYWLTERGQLRLADGKVREAVGDLRQALKANPSAEVRGKAREKLFDAYTELFQDDFESSAKQYLTEYQELCQADNAQETGKRKATFLYLMGRGREKQGELLKAYEYYTEFAALPENKDKINNIDDPYLKAKPDVWVRGRIAAMMANATPEQRKPLEDKIAGEWEKVRQSRNNLDAIRRFVDTFDTAFVVGRKARLELAEALMEKNDKASFLDAEKYLLQLRAHSLKNDPETTGKALEALARLYIRQGTSDSMRDAAQLYRQLGRDYPDTVIKDGKTGADLFNDLATDKRFLPYLDNDDLLQITGRMKAHSVPAFQYTNGRNNNLWRFQNSFTFEPEGEAAPYFQKHRLIFSMNTRQLMWVEAATNKDDWVFSPPSLGDARYYNYLYPYNQYNHGLKARYKFYQVKGHLAVVQIGPMVYGLDLSNKRVLWEQNLLAQNVQPNQNFSITPDTDGSLQMVTYDPFTSQPFTRKVGMVGSLTASYVALQTQKGLLVLDPIKGTELWTKSDVPARTQVFGDDQYIFLVETRNGAAASNARCLRASDGAKVDVPDFAAMYQNRLEIRGGSLLVREAEKGAVTLRLYDVRTGKDEWKKEYPADSIALQSEDPNLVGAITPDGHVNVVDLRTRKEVLNARLEDADLKDVKDPLLLSDRNQFFVVLNKPFQANKVVGGVMYTNFASGTRCAVVNGVIYAFDRKGKLNWYTFEPVANQMVVLEQFKNMPILLFTARYNGFNGNFQQWLCVTRSIDKKTGKLIWDEKPEAFNGYQYYALSLDPKKGTIDLIGSSKVIQHYVDDGRIKDNGPNTGTQPQQPQRPRVVPVQPLPPMGGAARIRLRTR